MTGRRLLIPACCAGVLLAGAPRDATGQTTAATPCSGQGPDVLTGYRFHLNAMRFGSKDRRFEWSGILGGDVDVIDYGVGRLNLLADYEVVLGGEGRPFDPNQGIYVLDVLGTVRLGATEIGGLFHHVSRHLSDRAKDFPIDWNMVGIQVIDRRRVAATDLTASVRLAGATKRSAVDYRMEVSGQAGAAYALSQRVSLLASGAFTVLPVVSTVFQRETQRGGRLEGGVRLTGPGAALELFVAGERRIDASPLERLPRSWVLAGFRILNR